jgi:hypothetical protein
LLGVVGGVELSRWNMAERLEEPAIVEPIDPLEHGEFDGLAAPPGTATVG